jgi:type II secretory pathway predicted ATPase ExeA/septal ring-binding cell division protein DamX
MYLEHFNLKKSPFAEEPDPDIFFKEAGREKILKALSEDLQTGKPLIRITGSEGSGKTLLCRVLQQRLADSGFEVVYLDNPVGSFDDLLHVVCLDLGMDPATVPDRNMLSELRTLLSHREDVHKKVLLIVDEAEKLFLAALERLMRALCEVNGKHTLQVLLAGRPTLNANLDQLTVYCSDVDMEGGYVLEPLSEEETARYLNFRLNAAGLSTDSREEIFTEGAVHKIFESAGGNLRLINILAEEALRTSSTDKSFLVLLDHVASQNDRGDNNAKSTSSTALTGKKIILSGGGVLILLLLVFLINNSWNKKKTEPIAESKPPLTSTQVTEPPQLTPARPEAAPEIIVEVTEEQQAPEAVVPHPSPEQPAPELHPDQVVELKADKIKSLPATPGNTHSTPVETKRRRGVQSRPMAASSANRNGEQLYQERLKASAKWLAGAYHNVYTVQLMMLASEQAAPNIKKMLVEDEYYAIKNNFYILRKKTSPPTLFVFYGTYDSMEQARQARNNMPLFLRKHHPYALSISDALKKTED